MSKHPQYEDLMMEALFDDISPTDRRRLEAHLDACDACRDEFESLQSTLDVMAQRERDELPEAYWTSYRRQVEQKLERRSSRSWTERLRRWWQSLPVLLPQTGAQWAVQGALAVLFVAVGLWLGRGPGGTAPMAGVEMGPSDKRTPAVTDLLLSRESVELGTGRAEPIRTTVDDVSFDRREGTVEVRYHTVNDVTVTGAPDDPTVRRLLRMALLDANNPSAQLQAVQTLEQTNLSPSDELVQALTVLIREEENAALQIRAVRALRSLHRETPLAESTRSLLVGLVLDSRTEALRVEALKTLRSVPESDTSAEYLYAARNDPNDYVRYQARAAFQNVQHREPASMEMP